MSEYLPCECGGTRYRKSTKCRDCRWTPLAVLLDELQTLAYETPERAAERLGMKPAAIARRLYRAGLPDLAGPFSSAYKREQTRRRANQTETLNRKAAA